MQAPLLSEDQLAAEVAHLRADAPTLERQQLCTTLASFDEAALSTSELISSMHPAGTIDADAGMLDSAARSWAQGARLFEVGIIASIGPGITPPAVGTGVVIPAREGSQLWGQVAAAESTGRASNMLQSAQQEMSVGDNDYSKFISSLFRSARLHSTRTAHSAHSGASANPHTSAVPQFRWLSDSTQWTASALAVFAEDLATSTTLAPAHQVSIVVASINPQPIPTLNANSIP
ncbi:MAG TPA: hypothetical protein VMU77_00960, partial [Acidimicrobiales bacterium]|nr:hypothetical protein [Acidimicrobiales bacterium]